MFYLTPQERRVLALLLAVCLAGSIVSYGFNSKARPFRWLKTASTKVKARLPDINTAAALELDKLPGIGPKTSRNIIAYRTAHGPFLSLDDLGHVKGITKKNLALIRAVYESVHD